jgi:carboxypeptidase C (cathepsin A)
MRGRHVLPGVVLVVLVGAVWFSSLAASGSTTETLSAQGDAEQSDAITSLPGLGKVATKQYGGYASVNEEACAGLLCDGAGEAGLYYWFVSKPGATRSTPTILWTNGGPGSTSFWSFTENGPYEVVNGGKLREREKAWSETANFLIFDQPLGVGLSFAPDDEVPANVQAGVDQWYQALLHFLERHPEVADAPIILSGESYGGTYIPLLAKAILDGNERAGKELVRLGGLVLVSPWVDPLVQQSMDSTFALSHGIISAADKPRIDQLYDDCRVAIEAGTPTSKEADVACYKIKAEIEKISGLYMYNIASPSDPPTKPLVNWLNRADVRTAIHARPDGEFSMFSQAIGDGYMVGEQDSRRALIEELLGRDVQIMLVSGLNDASDVNPLGTAAWLELLQGDAANSFHAAPTEQWKARVDGESKKSVLGYVQDGGQLSWVKVRNAGHLVPSDQPLIIDLIQEKVLAPATR